MKERIYGFDIVRLVFFIAIYIFHLSLALFYTTEIASSRFSTVSYAAEALCSNIFFGRIYNNLSNSHVNGFLRFRHTKKLKIFSFMIFAWLIFQLILAPAYDSPVGWDVYPLILFSIGICLFCRIISDKLVYLMSLIGFCMMWIPFWEYRSKVLPMSEPLQNILGFVDCNLKEADEWPILPWAGICWLSYGIGLKVGQIWKKKIQRC